jgi:hypothetical protein
MSLTNFGENALVDWLYRGEAAPTLPTDWYLGLFTVAPSDTGGGTEVSGNSYARVAVTRSLAAMSGTQGVSTTDVSSGTGGLSYNNATLTFPTPSGNWGTVVAAGIFTASTGGTLWAYGTLAVSKVVQTGDPLYFSVGQFSLGMD